MAFNAMTIPEDSRKSLPWKTYSSDNAYINPLNFVIDLRR